VAKKRKVSALKAEKWGNKRLRELLLQLENVVIQAKSKRQSHL
jgi:hypothetical protein